ncbi:Exocyst complex component 6B [Bagarius yarrelli]|uniref:Exocyst complex component n=1 Tax=Bagarius yarrelli TaxID=175774 RepID=A0A556TYZ7_BAGYA|nr:Exocyst complex component 6B [Bagarius yarrelli]
MASAETAAEHERILREIESTDTNCIGPTLRSVYDGQEHGHFMDKLEGRIRNHDREIEKMCNHHFQGFVDSITELLKGQVTETNQKLQNNGKELLGTMDELRQCRLQQRNIATTIDKLAHCLPVLEMYSRLQEQMRAKRYYPALRTLEQLEQNCLPKAGRYRFCAIMTENIPVLRTHIRDVSMSDLKDFLESIRKHSDKIGETAIKQRWNVGSAFNHGLNPGDLVTKWLSNSVLPRRRIPAAEVPGAQDLVDFSPVYRCLHIYTVLGARDTFENYYRKQRRKQARLVLQPHSNMHETLEGYRRYFNQIVGFFVVEDHVLHTTQGLVNRAYVEELWELALSKTIAALRTHSSYCTDPDLILDLKSLIVLFADTLQGYGFPVNQLFDMVLEMRDQYGEILLKKWNQSFRQILDQDNYSPIPAVTEEEYQQITCQFPFQDSELDKMPFPKKFPFSEFVPKVYSQLKEFIYACLKYSEDLHLSSTEIDDMIRKSTNLLLTRTLSHCLQYAIKKKNVGLAELVQIIVNTTHLELSCHYLEEFISNITNVPPDTVNTTKLYGTSTFKDARHAAEEEIYTNLNLKIDQFLQLADYDWMAVQGGSQASDYLSDLIAFLCSTFAVFTHLPGNPIEHARLPGKVAQTACMSACKHLSTSMLQLLLEADVRQVSMGALQQFNVDVKECEKWRCYLFTVFPPKTENALVASHPSPLKPFDNPSCLFTRFGSHLGPCAAPHVQKNRLIGFRLWSYSTKPVADPRHDSVEGAAPNHPALTPINTHRTTKTPSNPPPLPPLNLPLSSPWFARAGPVPGFQGDTLLLAFIDLRQLLDLFTQWDWSTYLADYGRPTCKYLRVNPHTALALLEKMKDTSRKNNMFAQFRKNERDKQKLIDTVIKQLRNLIASHQS